LGVNAYFIVNMQLSGTTQSAWEASIKLNDYVLIQAIEKSISSHRTEVHVLSLTDSTIPNRVDVQLQIFWPAPSLLPEPLYVNVGEMENELEEKANYQFIDALLRDVAQRNNVLPFFQPIKVVNPISYFPGPKVPFMLSPTPQPVSTPGPTPFPTASLTAQLPVNAYFYVSQTLSSLSSSTWSSDLSNANAFRQSVSSSINSYTIVTIQSVVSRGSTATTLLPSLRSRMRGQAGLSEDSDVSSNAVRSLQSASLSGVGLQINYTVAYYSYATSPYGMRSTYVYVMTQLRDRIAIGNFDSNTRAIATSLGVGSNFRGVNTTQLWISQPFVGLVGQTLLSPVAPPTHSPATVIAASTIAAIVIVLFIACCVGFCTYEYFRQKKYAKRDVAYEKWQDNYENRRDPFAENFESQNPGFGQVRRASTLKVTNAQVSSPDGMGGGTEMTMMQTTPFDNSTQQAYQKQIEESYRQEQENQRQKHLLEKYQQLQQQQQLILQQQKQQQQQEDVISPIAPQPATERHSHHHHHHNDLDHHTHSQHTSAHVVSVQHRPSTVGIEEMYVPPAPIEAEAAQQQQQQGTNEEQESHGLPAHNAPPPPPPRKKSVRN